MHTLTCVCTLCAGLHLTACLLVAVWCAGSEGFFGQSDPSLIGKNPADWAAQTGQDFLNNNKNMDFAVTHAWPDNWQM